MRYLLRQLVSIFLLPGMVVVVVPWWIAESTNVRWRWPASLLDIAMDVAAAALFAVGLVLFAASLGSFWRRGRGTLAPWDPPRRLVVSGPYRWVRNPMISGVILMVSSEALALRSIPHAWWALAFTAANALYIPLVEEPSLERRFLDDYRRYRAHVPRLLPRLRPWTGSGIRDDNPRVADAGRPRGRPRDL